jgi:acyl-coenzyme A synthetase/AMP-(fatty) acid ligase
MLKMPLPWVKKTIFTGEALSLNVANEWKQCAMNTSIDNAYGPTEGTVWSLIYSLDDTTSSQTINGLCPIGQPLKNILMKIVDEEGREVEPGERGELWIGGPQIFHGYVHLPEKTNEVLFLSPDQKYWYKTGDIVLKNHESQVVYINRKDNQVQVNGFRVELGEIEHHLRSIISSESAVVIAHERQGVMELYAFIQGDWDQELVLNQIRDKVPGYMVPRNLFILEQLPINTSGKIDKTLLKEKYIIS